jgi:hypothetical protein
MREAPVPTLAHQDRTQFGEALAHLEDVMVDGLLHGFFECSIACEIGSGGKRQLVIRSGKSHKFTIDPHELPR